MSLTSYQYYRPEGELLSESARRSLTRLSHDIHNRSVGIITAHRSGLSPEENNKRNDQLKADLKANNLSWVPVRGRYIENYGKPDQKEPSDERGFMVTGRDGEDSEKVRNFLLKHGEKYGQDSVLYKHRLDKTAKLLGTNDSGWPGKGQAHDVGAFKPDRAAEFHSVLTRGKQSAHYPKKGDQPAKKRVFSFAEGYVGDEPYLDEAGNAFVDFAFYVEPSFGRQKERLF